MSRFLGTFGKDKGGCTAMREKNEQKCKKNGNELLFGGYIAI